MQKPWIVPNWKVNSNIHALTTIKVNNIPFNLGLYPEGVDPKQVLANRQFLQQAANLPQQPLWLKQVHGRTVINANDYIHPENGGIHFPFNYEHYENSLPKADGSIAFEKNQVLVVLTADCLPVLLCDKEGKAISVLHAGWRGLASGIIEAAIQKLDLPSNRITAWLGPAIGPDVFEVREDAKSLFSPEDHQIGFRQINDEQWLVDMYSIARFRFNALGISNQDIYGGEFCTYSDPTRFYSFRGAKERGNMATLIWMT